MKENVDQICRFDMHPAFENYECPFINVNHIPKSCKELNCPLYVEIKTNDISDKKEPQ